LRQLVRVALLAVVGTLCAGCHSLEIDLYPLYRAGPVDNEGGWAWEALGPLLYSRLDHPADPKNRGKTYPHHEWGLRPLFTYHRAPQIKHRQLEVLWPVGRFRKDGHQWHDRILPVYWNFGNTGKDELREPARSSLFLFPIFVRRTGSPGKGLAIFPFYGSLDNFLGTDRVEFVMFPLYVGTERGARKSNHVVWPLFGWGSGQDAYWYRVFPFYYKGVRKGYYDRNTVLWPFFNSGTELIDTGRPRHSVFFWPFYGKWTRDQAVGWTVAWPFFRFNRDDLKGTGEHNVLWPFYQHWWSPGHEGWRIWPLYGQFESSPKASGSYQKSTFVLWPFFWDREYAYLNEVHRELRFVPIYHHGTWSDPEGGGSRWMVWPLMDAESHARGSGKFAVLSVFPIRIWNDAAHQRWAILISPYIRWWWADGRVREHSILGIYRRYAAPGFSRWTIPLLYSRRRSDEGALDQFLLGLIRYEAEATGASRLRILGVPIPLSSAAASSGAPTDSPKKERG